jgi:hypothetical protein
MNETAKPGDLLVASKTLLTIVLSDNTLVLKDVCLQWCLDLIAAAAAAARRRCCFCRRLLFYARHASSFLQMTE